MMERGGWRLRWFHVHVNPTLTQSSWKARETPEARQPLQGVIATRQFEQGLLLTQIGRQEKLGVGLSVEALPWLISEPDSKPQQMKEQNSGFVIHTSNSMFIMS